MAGMSNDGVVAADGSEGDGKATSVDGVRFREVLGHFATGVTIVTAMEQDGPVGFTCQSFTSLSLDPPMVALAPAKSSTSWPRIRQAGIFCVNVLEVRQEDLCKSFARSGGDKFSGVVWRQGVNGAPVLEGALAWIECSLHLAHDAGDHEIVFGNALDMGTNPGSPLLFYQGEFGGFTQ